MLLKLILLGACIWLIWQIFRKYGKGVSQARPPEIEEDMVRCARCGVHQAKSQSILSNGKFYCSEEHRRLQQEGRTRSE
jgi:uncharacterized protein